MATQGERLAALEQRMDAMDARQDAADEQRGKILETVEAIHDKITFSRGMVIGAVSIVGAITGAVAFLVNCAMAFFDAISGPR